LEPSKFLAADSHGINTSGEPMKSGALNPRLREMCINAGLPQRNAMYSFRRTRIIETKHEHGEATHADDSNAREQYDTVGVGDIDIQSYILSRELESRLCICDTSELKKILTSAVCR